VYGNIANLPLSNVTTGTMAFVSGNNRLYLWNGTGWFNIALINTNPTITGGANATYEFQTDGTPIVVSLTASDPEGIPITWDYDVTSGTLGNTAAVSQTGNVFTFTPSTNEADAGTFEITFTASDGVNIDTAASEFTLAFAVPPGQQAFTTPGTTSFVVPEGVNTICAVLIGAGATGGGGGGAGGSLRWINDLPVTPGETLTVFVGAGGGYGSTGPTTIKRGTDTLILASSNNTAGSWTVPEAANPSTAVGAGPFGGTVGGGNGGAGGGAPAQAGGGGAGGYSGNGGAGGANGSGGSAGSGGGGAGGNSNSANDNFVGGAGGGTGIFGEGPSGTTSRAGGSSGGAGTDGGYRSPAQGGAYGGGGGGTNGYYNGYSPGGNGAARIIWGTGRAFPSTNTQDMS
jgi:hypothetical protein